jgi:hypothetical protein
VYEDLRPLMFSIAYRMVGSASEAEDIVQEAFLRFHRESSGGTEIESPKAWLSTVTTRLAINHVQSARVRRESYFGTWLPEPPDHRHRVGGRPSRGDRGLRLRTSDFDRYGCTPIWTRRSDLTGSPRVARVLKRHGRRGCTYSRGSSLHRRLIYLELESRIRIWRPSRRVVLCDESPHLASGCNRTSMSSFGCASMGGAPFCCRNVLASTTLKPQPRTTRAAAAARPPPDRLLPQ